MIILLSVSIIAIYRNCFKNTSPGPRPLLREHWPDSSARFDVNIIVVHCLSWIFLCMTSLASKVDVSAGSSVHLAVYIVQPLAPAVTPVFFALNRYKEKQRRDMEVRLLKILKTRALAKPKT